MREVDGALTSEIADKAFAKELERFLQFRKHIMASDSGGADIYFPAFMMEHSVIALDGFDNMLSRDMNAVYKLASKYRKHSQVKTWACLARASINPHTGTHQIEASLTENGTNDKALEVQEAEDVIHVNKDEIQVVHVWLVRDDMKQPQRTDHTHLASPLYPHCAFARGR